MRFIGNKENLVAWIFESLTARSICGRSFFDFFSGTASVSRFFKRNGYKIFSSDVLYFSYCLQKAYIENNTVPAFHKLSQIIDLKGNFLWSAPLDSVLRILNEVEPIQGFLYRHYAPGGTQALSVPRTYLSDSNAQKIDAVRLKIEEWRKSGFLTDNEYYILLACLIESVSLYTNISGVYAAFRKTWDPRALKKFTIKPIQLISSLSKNKVFNENSMHLLEKIKADIIYLDPPYNARQYAPNYHLLETIARYDSPNIYGITGMRPYDKQKSSFCNKETALRDLDIIASGAKYKWMILSYNSEGIMPAEKIERVLKKYGRVDIEKVSYTRFKSNNGGINKKEVYEYLYILETVKAS